MSKPLIGISACLLGDAVRHNSGHKKDDWLVKELGNWVSWHKECPEMSMGLGSPRESMRLVQRVAKGPSHLVGNKTQKDYTELAVDTCEKLVINLPKDLNGYVLKNKSPSCGVEKIKVYDINDAPWPTGIGFFAKELIKQFPDLPVIEEGRLNNAGFREHFVLRCFAHHAIANTPKETSAIQKLHESYKFILLAHHEVSLRKLGPIAANSDKKDPAAVWEEYRKGFLHALSHPATTKSRVNAIQHIYGFVKELVTDKEKKSILDNIERYRQGQLPYVAMIAVLRHLIDKHEAPYIERQKFFSPYPEELNLSHFI